MWPFRRDRVAPFEASNLLGYVMEDGRRLFCELWATESIRTVHSHAWKLRGAAVDCWCDHSEYEPTGFCFRYCGHVFTIEACSADYCMFVDDPCCNSAVLLTVAKHFNRLLSRETTWTVWRLGC